MPKEASSANVAYLSPSKDTAKDDEKALKVADPPLSMPMLACGFMCFVPHALFLWHKYEATRNL